MVNSRKKRQLPHESQTSRHAHVLMQLNPLHGEKDKGVVPPVKKKSGTARQRPSRAGDEDLFNRMVTSAGQWFGTVTSHAGGRAVARILALLQTKLHAVLYGSVEARTFLDEQDQELVRMMILVEDKLNDFVFNQAFQRRRLYGAEFKQAFAPNGINTHVRIGLVQEAAKKAGVYEDRTVDIRAAKNTVAELAKVKAELDMWKARCQHFEDLAQKLQKQNGNHSNDEPASAAGDEDAH